MSNNRIIILIVLGVFLWGTIHAVGTYLNYHRLKDDAWAVWRAVIVLLAVEGFLGFWLMMMLLRRRRQRKNKSNDRTRPAENRLSNQQRP